VLQPVTTDAGSDYYRITQTPFVGEILPGVRTPLWGYNGMVPGPTIKARRGRQTVVRQVNQLPATHPTLGYVPWTSTHLHGMPSKPQYDGYASDVSQPGQWKDYVYPNGSDARTLWYHDHGVHHTAENVYMGLFGQYHLGDAAEEALPIPQGRYDVPLTLSDVTFAEDGSLLWDDNSHSGVFGDVVLVNGRPWPTMQVEQRRYRFRVLNASLSRGYTLGLSNGQPFQVIGTDSGLVAAPQSVPQLRIGMAERYEVVIDFSSSGVGEKLQLLNSGVPNVLDYDNTDKVMQFEVTGPATSTQGNEVPAVLGAPPAMAVTPASSRACGPSTARPGTTWWPAGSPRSSPTRRWVTWRSGRWRTGRPGGPTRSTPTSSTSRCSAATAPRPRRRSAAPRTPSTWPRTRSCSC
jgi:FtsP/CotA-like multicopper oxidase with cupredoxin domain